MKIAISGPALARAEELDALDGILPFDRRDQLALLLTDEDVAALKQLVLAGTSDNTLKAIASDLAYLETWCHAVTEAPLPWPAPQALILAFIAHHLWDPERRISDPAHGMPAEVETRLRSAGLLRVSGPHAPSTVKRRLASWSALTQSRGLEGEFLATSVRSALHIAIRAQARPQATKSQSVVTGDVLTRLLATCSTDRLADLRDRALLLTAFASGGRRRAELAGLHVEDLIDEAPVAQGPDLLPCMTLRLDRTRPAASGEAATAVMVGRSVEAVKAWLAAAEIAQGAVFRRIDQWGHVDRRGLTPQAVNLILKARCEKAGLDATAFSAHGLRAGYLVEAAALGVPLQLAMQQSQHRSTAQASRYYREQKRRKDDPETTIN
jgi:site-specific recombinase XerD